MKTKEQQTMKFKRQLIALLLGILVALSVVTQAQETSFDVEVSGQGQPVILIPGLSCSGDVWKGTVRQLNEKGYQCHVLTLPGFAGQPAIDLEGGFLPVMADEIVSYLKQQQLSQPDVIGHSLGGFLALMMGIKHPGLLGKLVIVDSYPFMSAMQNPSATEESMKPMAASYKKQYLNMTRESQEQQLSWILGSMIGTKDSIAVAKEWSLNSDLATIGQAMYELYTTDLRDEVAQIKSPTLVLAAWAGFEQFGITKQQVQGNLDTQYKKLPNVRIALSDRGRHFLMWDAPEFTNGEIMKFLTDDVY